MHVVDKETGNLIAPFKAKRRRISSCRDRHQQSTIMTTTTTTTTTSTRPTVAWLLVLWLCLFSLLCPPCLGQGPDNQYNDYDTQQQQQQRPILAMIAKSLDNPFFAHAHQACLDQAFKLGFDCRIASPAVEDATGASQVTNLDDLVRDESVQGVAVAVVNATAVGPALERAVQAGLAVVTFDSDVIDDSSTSTSSSRSSSSTSTSSSTSSSTNTRRAAYIGTDNYFFGKTLGVVLQQLQPAGGTYVALVSDGPNLQQRLQGLTDELSASKMWTRVAVANYQGNLTLVQEQLYDLASQFHPLTAMVPVSGAAMRSGAWEAFALQYADNITLVSGDAMPNQLEFLNRGLAHGLVGQLPYEMGATAMQRLYEMVTATTSTTTTTITTTTLPFSNTNVIIGTNVLSHILIPLELPTLTVNHNLIGNLHIVGYILFGMVVSMATAAGYWTYRYRTHLIVKAAQPSFLYMILIGVIIMAAAVIPLSFDDKGSAQQSDATSALQCMSVPWLGFVGFTVTFCALWAKTRRINRMFYSQGAHRRQVITRREILVPCAALLVANVTVLTTWTIVDPLVYQRQDLPGTDGWNRAIATYGSCQSEAVAWYLVPLAVLNLSVLVLANGQAYTARHIQSEFASEPKYVAFTNMSLLQATLTGVPVLFVVRESPQAFYLLLVFMIFVTCTAVLGLIFVPKLVLAEERHNSSRYGSSTGSWQASGGLGGNNNNNNNNHLIGSNHLRYRASAASQSTTFSTGGNRAKKSSNSSSSSRRSSPMVGQLADNDGNESSSSTFKGAPPSDSGDMEDGDNNTNTQEPVKVENPPSGGIFRKSSSTESKSVRWSEIEVPVETTPATAATAGSTSPLSEPSEIPQTPQQERPSASFADGSLAQDVGSAESSLPSSSSTTTPKINRDAPISQSSESTVQGFGSVTCPSESESSWVSYGRQSVDGRQSSSDGIRSSLRSSAASLRSSGLVSLGFEADQLGELDTVPDVEEDPSHNTVNDDLPPLVSCTEADVEAGMADATLSDDEDYTDPDDSSRRASTTSE